MLHQRSVLGLVAVCGLSTALFAVTAAPAFGQQTDPVAEADQAVADAQAQVDRVAGAYFDALERTRQVEARISELQDRTAELWQRVSELKKVTRDRAVAAYKRSGSLLEIGVLDESGTAETARRIKMLDLLNAHDDEAVQALRRTQHDLSDELRELDAAREKQSSAVARLREEGQHVNAKLVEAQNERQAAIDQQIEAQRRAEEAAAAAAAAAADAAATPPPAPTPPAPPSPPSNATPAPVPATRAPNAGVHPQHDHPYLRCVRFYESTNNYQAYNPGGPAYGAYQFLQPTWNLTANHAGRGDLVGLDPRRASEFDQDEMAWTLYQWQGKRPWSVDPC